ncbi:hypothetical protein QBC36DRAFT_371219 [Triangularia setosa]|uniref:Uncharacterized protein n=1 Tax=Triangularia setosa TaxID=2587417 RepID=A0AAN7A240_9PEZI|nr:hypothetical protein QBC36DRAFT_371219 [Podospora setosa]
MRSSAKLPQFLWREITRAAVYLHNRTPKQRLNGKTPIEAFHSLKRKKPTRRRSSNLELWARDVVFQEDQIFSGKKDELVDELSQTSVAELAALISLAHINDPVVDQITGAYYSQVEEYGANQSNHVPTQQNEDNSIAEETGAPVAVAPTAPENTSVQRSLEILPGKGAEEAAGAGRSDQPKSPEPLSTLLTPGHTLPHAALLIGTPTLGIKPSEMVAQEASEAGYDFRRIRNRHGPWEASFVAGRQAIGQNGTSKRQIRKQASKFTEFERPSSDETAKTHIHGAEPTEKIHRCQLPDPPKNYKQLEAHPHRDLFLVAIRDHLQNHKEMKSWEQFDQERAADHQVLGSM